MIEVLTVYDDTRNLSYLIFRDSPPQALQLVNGV